MFDFLSKKKIQFLNWPSAYNTRCNKNLALYRNNISIIYLNKELRTLKTLLKNHFGNMFLNMLLNTYLQGGRN